MEAKDTVMGLFQMNTFHNLGRLKTELVTVEDRDRAMCLAQAKITWDKAIREVVEWIEKHSNSAVPSMYGEAVIKLTGAIKYVDEEGWQAKLKEWGIK